jgi:hypothetical protein
MLISKKLAFPSGIVERCWRRLLSLAVPFQHCRILRWLSESPKTPLNAARSQ